MRRGFGGSRGAAFGRHSLALDKLNVSSMLKVFARENQFVLRPAHPGTN
jgi:hypothetical protein